MPVFFLLFVVIPVIEILLLIQVGQMIGGWYTVTLVLCSAFIGVNMLRYQGISTLTRAKQRLDKGELPLGEMRDGIVIAVGGALLITPGFVTDFLGFCCLIPYTRRAFVTLFSSVLKRFNVQSEVHYRSSGQSADPFGKEDSTGPSRAGRKSNQGDVIEGEYVDLDEQPPKDDQNQIERDKK